MANIIEITDLTIPPLQVYAGLTHADPGKISDVFLAESEKVIAYALKSGCRPVSFLMERQDLDRVSLIHDWPDIPVYTGSREIIRQLTGYVLDRGYLCAMERPALPALSSICEKASRVILLRNISDPTDLGAIFRSAAALGMDAILIGDGCCDPLYRRSVRVSMGTVFQVPWTTIAESNSLALHQFTCISVSQNPNATPIKPELWSDCEKLAIILDAKGSSDSWCIPLMPDTEPMNMAAASAVLFWMLRKP